MDYDFPQKRFLAEDNTKVGVQHRRLRHDRVIQRTRDCHALLPSVRAGGPKAQETPARQTPWERLAK